MRPKRLEHVGEQERAIEQLCDGLRGLRACGFEWPSIREQLLLFLDVMAGEEVDNSEKRAIAHAVEKSFREKKKKRKPAKKPKGIKPMDKKWFTQ